MNLFGIGVWEVLLVFLIALLVLGPERLPETAVRLARAVRGLRRFAAQVTGQFRQEFDDLLHEYDELRAEVQELRRQVDHNLGAVSSEIDKTRGETRQALAGGPILETSGEPLSEEKPAPPPTQQ